MLALSLILNAVVVFPLAILLLAGVPRMARVYGPDSPARRILACLYFAIGFVSVWALILMGSGELAAAAALAAPLFWVQIVYKLATLPSIGPRNPVVLANLAIAVLHGVTLTTL